MQLFLSLIIPALLATGAIAEHHWPGSGEHYGYQGPPAPLSSDGRVVDTPEVAHAKAAHLATHAEVVASMEHDSLHEVWEGPDRNNYQEIPHHVPQPYHGPPAPLGHDGRVVDTAEVAQAKAAHLAAHAQAAAKASNDYDYHGFNNEIWNDRSNEHPHVNHPYPSRVAYVHHYSPVVYKGPPAPLAPDGRVLDTPEVAKAKEAHLRAHAYAAALNAHRQSEIYYH